MRSGVAELSLSPFDGHSPKSPQPVKVDDFPDVTAKNRVLPISDLRTAEFTVPEPGQRFIHRGSTGYQVRTPAHRTGQVTIQLRRDFHDRFGHGETGAQSRRLPQSRITLQQ